MTVTVTLHGNLRRFAADSAGPVSIDLPDGARVADLLDRLGAAADTWLVAVNDAAVTRATVLVHGDRLDCYDALTGS